MGAWVDHQNLSFLGNPAYAGRWQPIANSNPCHKHRTESQLVVGTKDQFGVGLCSRYLIDNQLFNQLQIYLYGLLPYCAEVCLVQNHRGIRGFGGIDNGDFPWFTDIGGNLERYLYVVAGYV